MDVRGCEGGCVYVRESVGVYVYVREFMGVCMGVSVHVRVCVCKSQCVGERESRLCLTTAEKFIHRCCCCCLPPFSHAVRKRVRVGVSGCVRRACVCVYVCVCERGCVRVCVCVVCGNKKLETEISSVANISFQQRGDCRSVKKWLRKSRPCCSTSG